MNIKMTTKKITTKLYDHAGRPTPYDEKKHIPLLYEVFENMEGVCAFCDESLIHRRTFYNWLKAYPKFKESYEIALCRGARKWERLPLENPNISHPYWMTIMKTRFGYFKPKVDIKPNATPNEKLEAVWEGIREGELSAQEATQLASVAVVQSNIENNKVDDDNPFTAQTSEEIREKAEALEQLLKINKQLEEQEK
jgi:hypothetical protein